MNLAVVVCCNVTERVKPFKALLSIVLFSTDLRTVSDVFHGFRVGLMFFSQASTHVLHCMEVADNGNVLKVVELRLILKNLACASKVCCGYKSDGRTDCFEAKSFACNSKTFSTIAQVTFWWKCFL